MKRALVLCGGGSLGAYEMGAWKYLEERGEKFDIVTGTSIGALNAAMYAAGQYNECLSLWEHVHASDVMKSGINIANSVRETISLLKGKDIGSIILDYMKRGGVDIAPFKKLVAETIDPVKIKNSPIKCGIVTTDFRKRKEVDIVLNDEPIEDILPWLHASSACYPIFPIEKIHGGKYVDGGYFNNLPIDFAIKLGAEEIVAVLLDSIPKNPQHPELLDLPFVHAIRPSRDTGSILYFKSSVLQHNMMLGYLDAMKSYDEAWGFSYCFEKTDAYNKLIEEAGIRFVRENLYETGKTLSAMFTKDMPRPKTPRDLFIRSLELMASVYEIDPYKIWKIDDMANAIIENTKKSVEKESAQSAKKGRLTKKDILKSIYKNQVSGQAIELAKNAKDPHPEFRYISIVFSLLLGKNRQ